MNILLVGINAKYSHTNLAIRYLKNSLSNINDIDVKIAEYTINQHIDVILYDIYSNKPDVVFFSCYIWNIEYVLKISSSFAKLCPNTKICVGGPEVSFNAEEILDKYKHISYVLCGEGEQTVPALVNAIKQGTGVLPDGIYYTGCQEQTTPSVINMDNLQFPYFDIDELSNRVIYYESSRGCPFSCSYCLSSAEKSTRFRSLDKVFDDLMIFIDKRVLQVKFVDRTFNVDKNRATAIWEFLAKNDNGITGFHFEIGADLLEKEQIDLLKTVRPSLFQFEIGIQSTNEKTLTEICRKTDLNKLYSNVKAVKSAKNIHQHLDLIAGLPYEDYNSFAKSFDDVFALQPEMLQLGFLKMLKGTALFENKKKYDLIFDEFAPFEVLSSHLLSYEELSRLKKIEHMVETYYNTGRFNTTLKYLISFYSSAFEFFEKLSQFFKKYEEEFRSIGKYELYDILFDFMIENTEADSKKFKLLCMYDIMVIEKPKKLPKCLEDFNSTLDRRDVLDFLYDEQNIAKYLPSFIGQDAKFIIKKVHFEKFDFDVTTEKYDENEIILLCDYSEKTADGQALMYKISCN